MRDCVTCGRPEPLDAPFVDGQCDNCIRFGVTPDEPLGRLCDPLGLERRRAEPEASASERPSSARLPAKPQAKPSISCPFCAAELPTEGVVLRGQTVICPKCCAQVTMPGAPVNWVGALMWLLSMAFALVVLARGCAWLNVADRL